MGDEITAEHIAEQPGTRPHGWWAFTAGWLWRLHRGSPAEAADNLDVGTVLHLESEPHFLRRHRLLEPGERRRIPLAAFEPEEIVIADDEDTADQHPDEED